MKYGKDEIRDAVHALESALVYGYEPAALAIGVALDCLKYCLKLTEATPTLIPQDVIEQTLEQGYNKGWREGTEALIKAWRGE